MSSDRLIRPSGIATAAACNAQPHMAAQYPELHDPEASVEGTRAHEIGAQILRSYLPGSAGILTRVDFPNDPDEMLDAVEVYVRAVLDICNQYGLLSSLQIEQPVSIDCLWPGYWGTPDCWAYDMQRGVLYVWDYKHGHGYVSHIDNLQLISYAMGIISALCFGTLEPEITVVFCIVQPRCYIGGGSERTWSVRPTMLRGAVNLIVQTLEVVHGPVERLRTVAGDQCRYCSALPYCETAARADFMALDCTGGIRTNDPSPEALGVEYTMLTAALARLKNRTAAIEEVIKAHGGVPGWSVEAAFGRKGWAMPDAQVIAMGQLYGVDLAAPQKAITPSQAAKLKDSPLDADTINAMAQRKPAGTRVVSSKSTRAASAFSKGM